jgi:lysophospholipase L1-like esterase
MQMRRALAALALVAVVLSGVGCGGGSSGPTSPQDPRRLIYAAVGASDAVGIGAFPPTAGYVYKIAERMRAVATEVELHNLGISGAEIEEMLDPQLGAAMAAAPDVVTVWAGSNDVIAGRPAAGFAADLDRLIAELRSRTAAQVFVADLADLSRAPLFLLRPDPDVTAERIAAFNREIAAVAARRGAVLVRLSALPLDPSLFAIDGFHPSTAGHARIAELFWAEIGPRL